VLAVDKVTVQFGARTLFRNLCFNVIAKDRISFAGPNGAGKSTLLKIIAGTATADSGGINKARYINVGYLPQEGIHLEGRTLMEEAETAFEDVLEIQKKLAEADEQLGILDPTTDEYADALDVYGELQLHLEHHDVSRMKPRIERVLTGLGFSATDFARQTSEFSGGWQMRIALAKLLLLEPSVLLLDEPTNHLDIESQVWLESYLQGYNGSLVLVSHDRAFLDALITRTFAFEHGRVEEYAGNYSFYLAESVARREQVKRAAVNQQREIDKTEEFINRFRAKASKASQVQSRVKQLARMDRIEVEPEDTSGIAFSFPQPPRSGQAVIDLIDATKSYGDRLIFRDFNLRIERGDRIAIVGVNGAGKSTFSRILSGADPLTGGDRKVGHNVDLSHFAQNHAEDLDPKLTVLQTIERAAGGDAKGNLRSVLAAFLFRGDDVFKSVAVLSGGERSRLALAKMLIRPANFLILDEPTNHLDMRSQEVLQRALKEYTGAYVIVSHNRDFLDPVTEKVIEFYPGAKMPKVYLGNVSDFLEKKRADMAREAGAAAPAASSSPAKPGAPAAVAEPMRNRKEQRRLDSLARQQRSDKLKPLRKQLETVETTIATLEARRAEIEKLMADPEFFKDAEKVKGVNEEYAAAAAKLEIAFTEWSAVSEKLERYEEEFGAEA
jgi:ATP-binding cassette subfamily F protein 3